MRSAVDPLVLDSLNGMTPVAIACATWKSDPPPEPVHPEEESLVRRAVRKRQSAFRAGRHAAHMALAALERDCDTILAGERREPLWPLGCVGSISHTTQVSVAVAASRDAIRAVGVDIEAAQGLSKEEWNLVFTPSELTWLQQHPAEAGFRAMCLFSAKETLFKLQYPVTRSFVDFREATVELLEEEQVFQARLPASVHAALEHPDPLCGRYCRVGGLVLTAAWIAED